MIDGFTHSKDPLLYDRLIRRFQSAAEREEEGKRKGFAGGLEAGLGLIEAEREREERRKEEEGERDDEVVNGMRVEEAAGKEEQQEDDEDAVPQNKEEGRRWWRREMELRFLRGADEDFEYAEVDESEEYDDRAWEERRDEESWFEGEEPVWMGDGKDGRLTGQTGVQDF